MALWNCRQPRERGNGDHDQEPRRSWEEYTYWKRTRKLGASNYCLTVGNVCCTLSNRQNDRRLAGPGHRGIFWPPWLWWCFIVHRGTDRFRAYILIRRCHCNWGINKGRNDALWVYFGRGFTWFDESWIGHRGSRHLRGPHRFERKAGNGKGRNDRGKNAQPWQWLG
jgi:hypothetical protein